MNIRPLVLSGNFDDDRFVAEMNEFEIIGIEAALEEAYEDGDFPYSTADMELAYTSSSKYASVNVCAGNIDLLGYQLSHFALTRNGLLVAVCYTWDENEDTVYIRLN